MFLLKKMLATKVYKITQPYPLLNHLIVRKAHSDIEVPNWDAYRRKSCKNPEVSSKNSIDDRRGSQALKAAFGTIVSIYTAKYTIYPLVTSMGASAEVLALAQIEVKLADIAEGRTATFKWRGKPLFVTHRTSESIEDMRKTPLNILRDPEHDQVRVKDPNWLVVIGVCTHLGCVPIPNAGDFPGGYYCPCHGSHYDASGRIRKGPAPTNLEIPEYSFPDDITLLVG